MSTETQTPEAFTSSQQEFVKSLMANFEVTSQGYKNVLTKIRSATQQNIELIWNGNSEESIFGMSFQQLSDDLLAQSNKYLTDFLQQVDVDPYKSGESGFSSVNDKTIVKLVDNLRQQIIDEQKRSQQFAIDLKEIHDRQRKLDESLKSPSKARRSKKQKMGALTSVPIDIVEIKKT
jgi:hypothetical protein